MQTYKKQSVSLPLSKICVLLNSPKKSVTFFQKSVLSNFHPISQPYTFFQPLYQQLKGENRHFSQPVICSKTCSKNLQSFETQIKYLIVTIMSLLFVCLESVQVNYLNDLLPKVKKQEQTNFYLLLFFQTLVSLRMKSIWEKHLFRSANMQS